MRVHEWWIEDCLRMDGRVTKEVAMRMLTVSIVIGPLVLIGALPAAGQSTLALGSGAPVLLAAGNDTRADRDTYTQQGAGGNAGMATKAA